jgi:hypothetical protein
MYNLPEKIFLSEFKYFAQSRALARRGSKSDRMFMSLNKATPVL